MYALKLELKLNNKERYALKGCAGFRRFVYNFGLALVKDSWNLGIKGSDSKKIDSAKKILTNDLMKQEQYKWMKLYPSTIYQSAFQDLKDAFSRWRKGQNKLPVFKAKKDKQSFTVYKSSGTYLEKGKPALPFTNRQVLVLGKRITIPSLGKFRLKEQIPFICSAQTFHISREADKWYVSFVVDAEKLPPLLHEVVEPTGIDLGVKTFATLSDGQTYDAPKPMKRAKTKLAKIQWRNRRKQLGDRKQGIKASKNAHKYYRKLAAHHARIASQRCDFLQKTTTEISQKYAHIRIEDLNVQSMIANHKLSAAISDLGFYEFRRQLEYKAPMFGTRVELVDRWYPSSKKCNKWHHIQPMPLVERVFVCGKCGYTISRDLGAAINLKHAPVEVVRSARP